MANFFEFQEKLQQRRAAAAEAAAPAPMTVSQLTAQIERALKGAFPGTIHVRGEVSNFNHHRSSGHLYFTLKDPQTCIDCVMFKSDFAKVKFTPGDGMELIVSGRIAVYGQRGRYQLYVTRMEPVGQGALELAFKQLCAKLEAEGLFRPERKRPIPPYPLRLALVTSTATAAVQDMLKVLRRFPWVKILIYHVPVQGDGAAEQIADALRTIDRGAAGFGGIDLILLGRGGGSLEDLWEFNEEIVARAIVASRIPVVSGIGHEVDVSIADLVADYHAHTPTEAAQVAMANWRTVPEEIEVSGERLRRGVRTLLQSARQRLAHIERHEVFRRPLDRINAARQFMDDRQRAMALAMANRLRGTRDRLAMLLAGLRERHPRHTLELSAQKLGAMTHQIRKAMADLAARRRQRLDALLTHLNAVGPQQVLKRGYTITTMKKNGAIVRSASSLKEGDRLMTRFADGTAESIVRDQRQLPLFE